MAQQIISGEEFNNKYKDTKLVKVLNSNMTHFGFTYQVGVNIDTKPFDPTGNPGGLHFTVFRNIGWFLNLGTQIANVTIPNDAQVYIGEKQFKADRLIIEEGFCPIAESPLWADWDICLDAVTLDGLNIEYVKRQTPGLCSAAVSNNGLALEFVKAKNKKICSQAVKQNYCAFVYAKSEFQSELYNDLVRPI